MNDQPTTLKPDERFICVHIIIDASAPYLGVAPANNWIGRLVLYELLRQSIEAAGTLVSERGATGELNRAFFFFIVNDLSLAVSAIKTALASCTLLESAQIAWLDFRELIFRPLYPAGGNAWTLDEFEAEHQSEQRFIEALKRLKVASQRAQEGGA